MKRGFASESFPPYKNFASNYSNLLFIALSTKVISTYFCPFGLGERHKFPVAVAREEMASEKEASEASDAYYTTAPPERLEDNKTRPESSLSKALAHRALYGSNGSRLGRSSRKGRNKDIKVPASRLSKVSLADQTETAQ